MRMTQYGKIYLILVLVMILASINSKTNLMHLFSGFLATLLIFSYILSHNNLNNTVIKIEAPKEVFAGELLQIRYLIANYSFFNKFAIEIYDPIQKDYFVINTLAPSSTIAVYRECNFSIRGSYKWDQLQLKSSFPFGFVEKTIQAPFDHELLVLPKPLRYSPFNIPIKPSMFREGNFTSLTRIASHDFAGLRDYTPGDAIKNIHWKSTAKTGNLIMKEFEQELPAEVSIILDSNKATEDLFEKAIILTASLVWNISKEGYLILFVQGKNLLRYGRGEAHALKALRMLARANIEEDKNETIKQCFSEIPTGGTIFFIYFQLNPETKQILSRLIKQGNHVISISLENQASLLGTIPYQVRDIQKDKILLERLASTVV